MSAYKIEQLMEYPDYARFCQLLLGLDLSNEEKESVREILIEGTYNGKDLNTSLPCKDNPMIDLQRRSSYAYLYLRNRDTFKYITDHNIKLFHGTNSNALSGIIENGLATVDSLTDKGIEVTTGEKWSRVENKRDFISLTDILDLSIDYSKLGEDKDNFSVVVATNDMVARQSKPTHIHSDLSEVGILNDIDIDNIKAIMVPSDKVKYVKKLLGKKDVAVLALDLEEKFYNIDMLGYQGIYIDERMYEKFKNNEFNKGKSFSKEDIKHLALPRLFGGLFKHKGEENGRTIK